MFCADGMVARISSVRALRNISQAELAQALGVSQPRISQLERKPVSHGVETELIHKLAVVLSTGPALLAYGDFDDVIPPAEPAWDHKAFTERMSRAMDVTGYADAVLAEAVQLRFNRQIHATLGLLRIWRDPDTLDPRVNSRDVAMFADVIGVRPGWLAFGVEP